MTDLKKRTLFFNSGRQIELYGNSVAIGKSLEIAEGYAPNILSLIEEQADENIPATVSNHHKLTVDELMELADFNIQLWMDLKARLRKYGAVDPRIFIPDTQKPTSSHPEKPKLTRKRKKAAKESQKTAEGRPAD